MSKQPRSRYWLWVAIFVSIISGNHDVDITARREAREAKQMVETLKIQIEQHACELAKERK